MAMRHTLLIDLSTPFPPDSYRDFPQGERLGFNSFPRGGRSGRGSGHYKGKSE